MPQARQLSRSVRTSPAYSDHEVGTYVPRLTRRQIQVLRGVARGMTNRQIAEILGIAHTTVKWHLAGVMAKFDVANRTELSYVAVKRGLV